MAAFKLNIADLVFVLKQIKIAEAHANGVPLTQVYVDAEGNTHDEEGNPYTADDPGVVLAIPSPMAPFGLRTVDGTYNNIVDGREEWGAADNGMPRLLTPHYVNDQDGDTMATGGPVITNTNYGVPGSVADADPRLISNLIVDMSANNPAALFAALRIAGSEDPHADLAILMAARVTQAEANAAVAAAQTVYDAAVAAGDAADAAVTAAAASVVAAALAAATDAAALRAQADADRAAADAVDANDELAALMDAITNSGDVLGAVNAYIAAVMADQAAEGTAVASDAAADAAEAADAALAVAQAALTGAAANAAAAAAAEADALEALTEAQTVAADPDAAFAEVAAEYGVEISPDGSVVIPNVAPDEGLSRPFNAWMTFFGQFFDHGLDLINKGGAGTVYIPLQNDDPLVVGADGVFGTADDLPENLRFMVLTRATPSDDGSQVNQTTSWVDQNQTYTSHPSHQVFLREYALDTNGRPVSTGHLLDGAGGHSLPTWAEVKAQALMLGIRLEDRDVLNLPLIRTDQYGNFIPGSNGYAQVITNIGADGIPNTADDTVVQGTAAGINTFAVNAVRTGHAFLDDIAHNAVPQFVDPDRNPGTNNSVWQTPDADGDTGNNNQVVNGLGVRLTYDNELLDRHYITGDGRGNENIALTAVHHVFHSEHNRQVEQQKLTILSSGDEAFINEWLAVDVDFTPAQLANMKTASLGSLTTLANQLTWDGERLFQSARMATEMQYQHLVFEEFGRVIQPMIDVFVFNSNPDINGAIFSEFANVVYRFGHSMLTDSMARIDANGELIDDMGLINAFLNPVAFDNDGAMSNDEAVAALVRGMTIERGNEIDEFIVNSLRNNLLGLPLDLAAINIARGRDTGMPTLNQTRQQLYDASGSTFLEPYDHWTDFAANLKNPISVVNFIAAYGTHSSIPEDGTLEQKRDAAWLLVFGGEGEPEDRLDFLHGTGDWAGVETGLGLIDLWIGGLAEKQMPFGGMLGSTFNAIFELQMENLQDGDRFYYLTRTQGQNFLNSLEQNAFIKMIMANSDLAQPGPDGIRGTPDDIIDRHIGIDAFGIYDFVYEVDPTKQADYDPDNITPFGVDPVGEDLALESMGLGKVTRVDLSGQVTENYIRVRGGEHVTVGGTDGDDTIITDFGDDAIWGDAGDDRIESGAGVDLVNGGAGNDIITDSGDTGDFLKGDEGDDVIANSNGADVFMMGDGKDVGFVGVDLTEVFAGAGDDFIRGGADMDFLLGNEGDDWIEAGAGFDTTAGDNSELFFDSRIIGHDVMFAGADEHDFDGESGDDIMVQGESVMRNEGMFGFDWVTYKGVSHGADANMAIPIFTTEAEDILRNRFDKVEGLSGWMHNDTLIGDNRTLSDDVLGVINATTENVFFRDELNQAGIARIEGLSQLLTGAQTFQGIYGADFSDTIQEIFSGGNILLGGGGSDEIHGRGGDDIIDGDRWLNVRIRITEPGEANTAANQIATIDSLDHVFGAGAPAGWVGKSLYQLLIDRVIVPNQLHIVREILSDNSGQDTAVFWDVIENYDFSQGAGGRLIVDHVGFAQGNLPEALRDLGFLPVSDGRDTLSNIEWVKFGDGNGGFITYGINELVQFAASGAPVINDLTPLEGQTLSVNTASITDPNGLGPFSYQWQESADGSDWDDIEDEDNATLALADPAGNGVSALAGRFIRVVVTFTDGIGGEESLASAPTARVGINFNATGLNAQNFTALAGDDVLIGSNNNDMLAGAAGNDIIEGRNGNDTLRGLEGDDVITGGQGNDNIQGGAGIDTAVYSLPIINYALTTDGTSIIVNDVAGNLGRDSLMAGMEILRFGSTDYTVVIDQTGVGTANLNGAAGQNGSQAIFGRWGNDTMFGGAGSDLLIGGAGDDVAYGGTGDDFFFQDTSFAGRDVVEGGDGVDTYVLSGTNGNETFRIYTAAAATAAGITDFDSNAEIIITRNGANNASIIATLNDVEEIKINSLLTTANNGNGNVDGGSNGGDNIIVIGNFASTSLDYSTITINGSGSNDTVDITGLTSDHRVVFTSNGGLDTVVGQVRPQDVFDGVVNDQRFEAAPAASSFGADDGLAALVRGQLRGLMFGLDNGEGLVRSLPLRPELGRFDLDSNDLFTGLDALGETLGRTMVESPLDNLPLDLAGPAPVQVAHAPLAMGLLGFHLRSIMSDYDLMPS